MSGRGRVGDGCDAEKQLRFWSCGPGCGVAGWSDVAHQGMDGHGEALWAVILSLLGVKGHRHLLVGLL